MPRATMLVEAARRLSGPGALETPEALSEQLSILASLPRFFSHFARACRENRCDQFWNEYREKTNIDLRWCLADTGFLIRLGPEIFAFYLLLWELVQRSEER